MNVSATNIDAVHVEAIDVVAHRPGRKPTRGRITDATTIRDIQRACRRAERATCHMESYAVPKFFLSLLEENHHKVASVEVQAHVVIIGDDIVHTPRREVWKLVETGLRHSHPARLEVPLRRVVASTTRVLARAASKKK